MSGRGKGGKGLGKGGAKRHRKVLRDNIQGELGSSYANEACLPIVSSPDLVGTGLWFRMEDYDSGLSLLQPSLAGCLCMRL